MFGIYGAAGWQVGCRLHLSYALTGLSLLGPALQDVKEAAHWAQQVHNLNMEVRLARSAYEQVHGQFLEAQSMLEVGTQLSLCFCFLV